ncbi:MAG: recombinase family protein [Sphingomonas sp.]
MNAVIYARWSSLEQSKGSTLERQLTDCQAFCADRAWPVIEILKDEGKSAYTGDNIKTGALGQFSRRFEEGHYPPGTVLVVEQLDRVSRMAPMDVMTWIFRVVEAGLTIVTANDSLTISKEQLRVNQLGIISIVFNAFRAYSESQHKSDRIAKSWREKRKARVEGQKIAFTSVGPAWLKLNNETGKWDIVEERAEIVRRIFNEAERGDGRRTITRRLNAEGIEPWGRGKSKGNGWHDSYVQKILDNPAVIGEYQPHTKARGDDRRKPIGEPIPDYFPPIIAEAQFAIIQSRKRQVVKQVGRKSTLNNLLRGIGKCGSCYSSMTFIKKASAGSKKLNREGERVWTVGADESYLVCDSYLRRRGCQNGNHFNYRNIQDAVLDAILPLALDDAYFTMPDQVGKLTQAVAISERELQHKTTRAERAMELFMETGNPQAKEKWLASQAEADAEAKSAASLKSELIAAKGKVSPSEHLRRVNKVRSALDAADEEVRYDARSRVTVALREVVGFVHFHADRTAIAVLAGAGGMAFRFNDQGECLGSVGVLKQIVDGDEVMRSGLLTTDPILNASVDKVITRQKRRKAL